jgi:ubiquinone/menaquinone biosynthesis C-methylase UbiE
MSKFEFDSQAESYDARTQLGAETAHAIATSVGGIGRETLGASGPLTILEVGAGTGEIGIWLAREGEYTGFDVAGKMLEVFTRRLQEPAHAGVRARLHVADASDPWPVDEATIDVVFFSRVLHLLEPTHVVRELQRVAKPTSVVVLAGRTQRDRDSIGAELRRMMWTALEDRGYSPRRGERRVERFFEDLPSASRIPRREVATLRIARSPRERLDAWRNKGGLGGLDLPADERERVLDEVERWAKEAFSDLDAPETSVESYALEGAVLVPERG